MRLWIVAISITMFFSSKKIISEIKGRFLLFQVYCNFANLFFKLSVSTFYKEIRKFQQKVQSYKN